MKMTLQYFHMDLKKDPYEKLDLSAAQPTKVEELNSEFILWEKEMISPRWKIPIISTSIVEVTKVSFQP